MNTEPIPAPTTGLSAEVVHQLSQLLAVDEDAKRRIETANTPIEDLLEEFSEALRVRSTTREHAITCADHVRRVAAAIGATRISQLTPAAVQTAVGNLKNVRADSTEGGSLANATRNNVQTSVHNLFEWLLLGGRITHNPFTGRMRSYRVKGYERRKRRIISEAELARLIECTEWGPIWRSAKQQCFELDGPTRADIYRVAVVTGLRADEIRTLTVGQAEIFTDVCGIRISAARAKNRKEAFQRIPKQLADRLQRYVTGREAHERLFPKIPRQSAAMIRFDLRRASITFKTEKGQFDFHCLRKMCAALLAARNIPPKVIQTIMRHSTIQLSMDLYADSQADDVVAACNASPTFLPGSAKEIAPPAPAEIETLTSIPPSAPPSKEFTTIPEVKLFKPPGRSDEPWWIQYFTPTGRQIEEPVSTDKKLTEKFAREMWLRLESRRLGIFPNLAEAYQRGPIPPEELGPKHRLHDLLPDFEHALTSRGLSVTLAQRHVLNCRRVFYVLAAAGGADAQVTAASVNAAISTLRDRKTGKLFNGATRTHYRQSVTRLFDLLGHKTLELGQHSTIDLKVKEQALEPRHRLTDLLADFTDALIDQGLKAPRAKRHADRCQRVFSALAEAGGVDADASPEAIDAVVSAFRDKQTGDELNQESRQLYHQSVRRFFKVMKDKIVVGMESPALV